MLQCWQRRQKMLVVGIVVLLVFVFILKSPGEIFETQISRKVHCDVNDGSDDPKYVYFMMITVIFDGGIGNQLFEVFALLGIARTLNRTAIFDSNDYHLQSKLSFLREKLPVVAEQVVSIPVRTSETIRYDLPDACCYYQIPRLMLCEQSKYLYAYGSYFQSFKYFSSMDSSIRKWLRPPEEKRDQLRRLVTEKDGSLFKTCVHVRRGDFLTDGEHSGTDNVFAINAINHLDNLNPGLVFMFSNDREWVRKHIVEHLGHQENVRIMNTSKEDAIMDLYFSQIHCDSILITAPSSTFGWWLGYLSKNMSNVYYRDIREVNDKTKFQMIDEDFYPKEWNKMKMTQKGRVFVTKEAQNKLFHSYFTASKIV